MDDKPVRVATRPMRLEARLEELIEADPEILGKPLLLIGRQVQTDHGKVIDLLGVDAEGGLHVLELKRDRTPREVVAQLLDYGSWVQDLSNEQVREIYGAYARRRGLSEELDEAFAMRFGGTPPGELNSTHMLTVVASEVDAATERIVTYLASGYQVPLNVLFFRYFEDEGRSYLAPYLADRRCRCGRGAHGNQEAGQTGAVEWHGLVRLLRRRARRAKLGRCPSVRLCVCRRRGVVLPDDPLPACGSSGVHPYPQGGIRGCGHGVR
ncbi:endonuclease NucS domain-containing protein [Streptomyces melanogenes]|uniref:endonuclease NucS domain-containing protein n=1 Tax=Streptomyces melanogenes TaxID=67326 RepID=UPI003787565E